MSFSKWFFKMLATRLFIGVPLELLIYALYFGGVVLVSVWHTPLWFWNASPAFASDRDEFFKSGTTLYLAWITLICGALLVLALHANLWFYLIRVGTKAMVASVVGPLGFVLCYLGGAVGGKLFAEHFFEDFFESFYRSERGQTGMVLGAVLLGGIYLLISMVYMYARSAYHMRTAESTTVVQRARERTLR